MGKHNDLKRIDRLIDIARREKYQRWQEIKTKMPEAVAWIEILAASGMVNDAEYMESEPAHLVNVIPYVDDGVTFADRKAELMGKKVR
jgi:hypothetical protein